MLVEALMRSNNFAVYTAYQEWQEKADSHSLQFDSAAMSPEKEPWSRAQATGELTLKQREKLMQLVLVC